MPEWFKNTDETEPAAAVFNEQPDYFNERNTPAALVEAIRPVVDTIFSGAGQDGTFAAPEVFSRPEFQDWQNGRLL